MKHYCVVSPEVSIIIPILDDGSGPTEPYRYYAEVKANNKREAMLLALKTHEFRDWVQDQRSDRKNPFSGLKAEEMTCEHGKCWCSDCILEFGECDECLAEFENVVE